MALAGTRQLRSQGLVRVHAHLTEGVTGSERQEGSNGVGSGIGVGGGNGDGNRVGVGDEDGVGTGTGKGMEANERAQVGNGDGTGTGTGVESPGRTQDGNGEGSGDGNENNSGDGNGDENGNGNEDRIEEGGGEAKKRKKPHKTCRRHVGNGGDLGGKNKTRRKERVGAVVANLDNLEKNKEAGSGCTSYPGLK